MIHKLIKELPRAIIVAISIFVILQMIRFINGVTIELNRGLAVNFGYTIFYSFMLYFSNAYLFIYLNRVFEAERFTKKRLLIGFLGSFTISVFVIFSIRVFENVLMEGRSFRTFIQNEILANYLGTIIITFFVTLSFHVFYFYKAYQENRVKQEKIIAGNASAQFESLKNQLDPHFLFNSLNVLSSLIEENPLNAQKFTISLSKIYRYVLEHRDKELVSVADELMFAKTYMNLLKMRFENSITFKFPEDFENEDAKVVPLALQLLLENAIKHNVVSEQKPLHIKISIVGNQLIVENNLQKKETLQTRKGVGLQNILDRYAILTTRNVAIEETNEFFKIKLPILTKQISIMETTNIYSENMAYVRAKERVDKLKRFYGNLISYCFVIPTLIIINLNTIKFQWFWFPMLGWGLGLTFHALETFGYGKSWEERKIQEILNKDKEKSSWQ
jgi:hypothetical protein